MVTKQPANYKRPKYLATARLSKVFFIGIYFAHPLKSSLFALFYRKNKKLGIGQPYIIHCASHCASFGKNLDDLIQ